MREDLYEEILEEYAKAFELEKKGKKFVSHFKKYFKNTPKEEQFNLFGFTFLTTLNQIMSLRVFIGEEAFRFKATIIKLYHLCTIHGEGHLKNPLNIENADPTEIVEVKGELLLRHINMKALLKSFFIFNKMLYDVMAHVVILSYFKKSGQIGNVEIKPGIKKKTSYTRLFNLDEKNNSKTKLKEIDPEFFEQMKKVNKEYKNEIKIVREDFVHNFTDIAVEFYGDAQKKKLRYILIPFEDSNKRSSEIIPMELTRIPIENIDNVLRITVEEIIPTILNNFDEDKKNKFL